MTPLDDQQWRNLRIEDRPGRLRNKFVFLSASVPERNLETYTKPDGAAFDVEEAVVSLARAVFAEDGRLVFGGHPSISPLVASVAGDYFPLDSPQLREAPPVLIYQSKCYQGHIADTTKLLRDMKLADIIWTDLAPGEAPFNPALSGRQCLESVFLMRDRMLDETEPVAMVALGGMDGVEDEAHRFVDNRRGRRRPLYVFRSTYGAAGKMARESFDGAIVAEERWRDLTPSWVFEEGSRSRDSDMVPYALLMQELIAEISGPEAAASA